MTSRIIDRTITHWTGGGGKANDLDKKHYHTLTEHDGNIVAGNETLEDNIVTSDGDYAAHTLRLNTRSGGFAMAGMLGAVENPFDAGSSPINEKQFEAHCAHLAKVHTEQALPVNGRTCLTHAEVEPTLGVKQDGKWDLTRLPFKPEIRGAIPVGDYMRERVRAYQGQTGPAPVTNRPVLRIGDRGMFVKELQDLLHALGFHTGAIDQHFGDITAGSVRAFQAAKGLEADGVVGPATWAALMTAEPAPLRATTEASLREDGSRTIQTADTAQTGAKATSVAIGGLSALEVVTEALDRATAASGPLDTAQGILMENWPILLVIALSALIYFKGPQLMDRIRGIRVDDAKTGAHLGR